MDRLVLGASYPFRGLWLLIGTPRLWRYALIPLLINLVLGALLYGLLLSAGLREIDATVAQAPLGDLLGPILRVLLIILLLIVIGVLVASFGVTLGSPWYSRLSEEIELICLGSAPPAEPLSAQGITRDLLRALLFELKKLVLIIGIGLPVLLINLLPVAGQILSTVGGLLLGATIACLDFFDGPLERRRLRFRDKLGVIRRLLPSSLAFGLVSLGLVSIPLVNLLMIPLCVTSGTLFLCNSLGRDMGSSSRT
ncbi:MAG TPA: EI24 domain-containing protein [Roseiflexaceae bacterium]|nr:EI24 domain-containing protein [Roseiflexaceae bacterium]